MLWICVLAFCALVVDVNGHGRIINPAGRSTMWRYGYDNPPNYNDNELNCGGFGHQWNVNNGKCGVCGDGWGRARENEAGGRYANGVITGTYNAGQVIDVTIQITTNHKGWHEFRLCAHNDPTTPITHDCLDQNLLELADGSGTRWYWTAGQGTGDYTIRLRLPPGLTCSQCVLQWLWNCGNSWNCGPPGDEGCCTGCGPQENFLGCADISIV